MKRSGSALLPLVALFLLAGRAAQAQSATYNFDAGQTDFQNNFNFTTSLNISNDSWTYKTGSGIGGSNAVAGPGAFDCTAIYQPIAFANVTGTTITASAFFQAGQAYSEGYVGTVQGDFAGICLVGSPTSSFDDGSGHPPAAGSIASIAYRYTTSDSNSNDQEPDVQLSLDNLAYNSSDTYEGGSGVNDPTHPVTVGHWYQITATYQFSGSSVACTTQIADYGSSGTTLQSILDTTSGTVTNPFSGSNVYVGMYAGTRGGNVAGAQDVDNFAVSGVSGSSAAPEPAALALLLPALAPLAAVGGRRRRIARS